MFPSFISRPQTFCRAARRWSYATNTLFVSSQEIRRRANSRLQQNSHLQLNLEESKNMKSLFGLVISACRRRVSVLWCGEDNESHQTPQKLQVVLENSERLWAVSSLLDLVSVNNLPSKPKKKKHAKPSLRASSLVARSLCEA